MALHVISISIIQDIDLMGMSNLQSLKKQTMHLSPKAKTKSFRTQRRFFGDLDERFSLQMVWAYPQTIPYPQLVTFGKAISAPSKTHLLFIYYLFICSFFKFLLSRGWVLLIINDISIPMDTPLLNRHRFDIKIPHRKPVNISRIVKSLSKSNWWYWLDADNSTFI